MQLHVKCPSRLEVQQTQCPSHLIQTYRRTDRLAEHWYYKMHTLPHLPPQQLLPENHKNEITAKLKTKTMLSDCKAVTKHNMDKGIKLK